MEPPGAQTESPPAWRRFLRRWSRHRHTDNAAALTFYALVSLPPLLLFGVTLAGIVLGERAAHGELEKQMTAVVGPDAAGFLESVLQSARVAPVSEPLAFALAMVSMMYAGSHVLSKLRGSLNLVNEGEDGEKPERTPFLSGLLARGVASLLIVLFGALLVVGTMAEGFVRHFAARVESPIFDRMELLQGYQLLSTYLLLTLAFVLSLKILPRCRPKWRHAFVGAAISALVVGSLKSAVDVYLRHSFLSSMAGAGLALLVFLFWLFFSIQAFLAGAEVAAMMGRRAEAKAQEKAKQEPEAADFGGV